MFYKMKEDDVKNAYEIWVGKHKERDYASMEVLDFY
jgi:hypothetical protein